MTLMTGGLKGNMSPRYLSRRCLCDLLERNQMQDSEQEGHKTRQRCAINVSVLHGSLHIFSSEV